MKWSQGDGLGWGWNRWQWRTSAGAEVKCSSILSMPWNASWIVMRSSFGPVRWFSAFWSWLVEDIENSWRHLKIACHKTTSNGISVARVTFLQLVYPSPTSLSYCTNFQILINSFRLSWWYRDHEIMMTSLWYHDIWYYIHIICIKHRVSERFHSAPSSPLLLRGAPDTAQRQYLNFRSKRHCELRTCPRWRSLCCG